MALSCRKLLRSGVATAAVVGLLIAAPAGAIDPDQRCFAASAGKRKTSLGVHQWTARQQSRWCAKRHDGRWRIVSVSRRTIVKTGTNWRLISRNGDTVQAGSRVATSRSRFHFRLRYPYLEQNCYPRIELTLWPSGESERSVRTGC